MVLPGVAETNDGNASRPGKVRLHFWSLDRAKLRCNSLIETRIPKRVVSYRSYAVDLTQSHRVAERKTGLEMTASAF
jgi:hypothetical protein